MRYSEHSSLVVKYNRQTFSLVCIVVLWFGSCSSWWVYLSCYAAVMNDAFRGVWSHLFVYRCKWSWAQNRPNETINVLVKEMTNQCEKAIKKGWQMCKQTTNWFIYEEKIFIMKYTHITKLCGYKDIPIIVYIVIWKLAGSHSYSQVCAVIHKFAVIGREMANSKWRFLQPWRALQGHLGV